MTFAGGEVPFAYVEIKSIGSLTPLAMSDQFCELIKASLGIAKDRIYWIPPRHPVPQTQRRMLRHNAVEAWQTMLKTGWQRCQPPMY